MTAVHDAVQVGVEIAAPFLRVGFPEQRRGTHVRVRSGVAGVVDQQRDGAERCLGLFERGFHRSVVADIRLHRFGLDAECADFVGDRSEERREGTEWVSTGRSRWATYN